MYCKKELVNLDPVIEDKITQLLMEGEADTDVILKQCRHYSKDVIFAGQFFVMDINPKL